MPSCLSQIAGLSDYVWGGCDSKDNFIELCLGSADFSNPNPSRSVEKLNKRWKDM